ncbi:hypothetical protein [Candidatus Poriferisodalis sp.]|uniref:hypothetical protein n=1 Tax=Candidatus Poriferisodalis sp. TaxID=3101277 RepID=UPI003B01058A
MSMMAPSGSETSDATTSTASATASDSRPLQRISGGTGAELLAEAARILGLLATLVIVGGLAFMSSVVRDEPSDTSTA